MASIPSNYQCRLLVERIIFGKECRCPKCSGSLKRSRKYYWCNTCRKKLYLRSLTWLKGSKLSYQSLFLLILAWQGNVAPGAVNSLVKLSHPTIARWYERFRVHLPREVEILDGTVEVDESYFGRKKHDNQRIVIGALLRDVKKLRLKIIPNGSQDELEDFIWENIAATSLVYSDGNPGYYDLTGFGYGHEICNHSKGHFGGTNQIEATWSWIKRQIRRVYGQIKTEKLEQFIVEWEARVNYPHLFEDPKNYLQVALFAIR